MSPTAPHSPIRAAVARRLFRHAVARLPIRVIEAGRAPYGGGGRDAPPMRLVRPQAFFQPGRRNRHDRVRRGLHGRRLDADDLAGVLTAFAAHMRDLIPPTLQKLRHAVLRREPETDDNTITGARTNISRHYDLSNDLFTLFLDESLTYSSALYAGRSDRFGRRPRDRAATQDRPAARRGRGARRQPGARDRFGLG